MELEEQRRAQAPWTAEEPPAGAALAGRASAEAPPPPAADSHPMAAALQKAVDELVNRDVVYEEPAVQDLPPEQQSGQHLWNEFSQGKPPPLGEAVEEDPERFASGAPTVTMVLTPAQVAERKAKLQPPPAAEPPPESPVSAGAAAAGTYAAEDAPERPAEHAEAQPSAPGADSPRPAAERASSGKRALLETPPVRFGGAASARDKSGRRRSSAPESAAAAADASASAGAGGSASPPAAEGHAETPGREQRAEVPGGLPATEMPGSSEAKPFIAPKQPEEELDPEQIKKLRWKRLVEKAGLNTLGWSVAAHIVLLILAAMWGLTQMAESPVDFLPGGGSAHSQAAEAALTNRIQQKKNPWIKAKPQMRKVTVQSIASEIVLPEMPMDALDLSSITNRMDISKAGSLGLSTPAGMGTGGSGGGFGAGIGRGGKFSFVGQTALGRRVVFVVDVSGSMSAVGNGESISRFDLLKKELIKSVNAIPMNTQYQILFFSDFAWPHDEVDSRDVEALTKYRWEIDPRDYKKVKIPPYRFIQATPFTIRETVDIIQRSDNPGGTNWGAGLLMALNASPKPDVIFFMTDGLRSDEMGWVDIVTAENKRRLPATTIHTSAMQQPDAARELDNLARRNNGKFTVVLGDGKIVKGEDFFKKR